MSEDAVKKLFEKLAAMDVRLARLEVAIEERAKNSAQTWSTIAWIFTTCVALYAAVHK